MDIRKKTIFFFRNYFFVFGLITAPWEGHQKWVWRGLICFSIPLFCMLFRSQKTQAIGIVIGATLVLQTLISPIFFNYFRDVDLITLSPNIFHTKFIPTGIYPGLDGSQVTATDDKGYRVTKPINYTDKPIGHFRIFTLGGSTTAGFPFIGIWNNWPHLSPGKN